MKKITLKFPGGVYDSNPAIAQNMSHRIQPRVVSDQALLIELYEMVSEVKHHLLLAYKEVKKNDWWNRLSYEEFCEEPIFNVGLVVSPITHKTVFMEHKVEPFEDINEPRYALATGSPGNPSIRAYFEVEDVVERRRTR